MNLTLSQAIDGFILSKQVAGLSPYSIRNYSLALRRFADFLPDDPALRDLHPDHIRRFIHQFQTTELEPGGAAPRPPRLPSPKTVLNTHLALSSLWTWAIAEGYADRHIVRIVDPPSAPDDTIDPLDRNEIRALIQATAHSAPWQSHPYTRSARPQIIHLRDHAIILFLLDTGVRASELCNLRIVQLQLKDGSAMVAGKSRKNSGRGKQRMVHFGRATRKALWQYHVARDNLEPAAPVFANTSDDSPISRRHLATHLRRLGERAGVPGCHPHRFRHTFAINYLRNGGDVFTLQSLLGHTSLDMVRKYLKLAQADIADTHRRAGPVDNWNL
jgi:site-specific recombinase XerD